MSQTVIKVALNGVTGRMGYRQHLVRSILAIREQGGVALADGGTLLPEPILLGMGAYFIITLFDGGNDTHAIQEAFTKRFGEKLPLEKLNDLLFQYETLETFCVAHEVFDLNSYKILRGTRYIQRIVRQQELKPFQFLCNKN